MFRLILASALVPLAACAPVQPAYRPAGMPDAILAFVEAKQLSVKAAKTHDPVLARRAAAELAAASPSVVGRRFTPDVPVPDEMPQDLLNAQALPPVADARYDRGRVDGPKRSFHRLTDQAPHSLSIEFAGAEPAVVLVETGTKAPIELTVVGADHKSICRDRTARGIALCLWYPSSTQAYRVTVQSHANHPVNLSLVTN